jgi:uncharacterized RDD family membrane protein YckC
LFALRGSFAAAGETQIRIDMSTVRYAGLWRRFAACLVDLILTASVYWVEYLVLLFVVIYLQEHHHNYDPGLEWPIGASIVAIIIQWIYWAGMESSSWQATWGKMILGIAVCDVEGRRISFTRATGRHFAKILSALILCVGFMMAGVTEKKRGLHDIIGGCFVVVKR